MDYTSRKYTLRHYRQLAGCDSVMTLNLTINNPQDRLRIIRRRVIIILG